MDNFVITINFLKSLKLCSVLVELETLKFGKIYQITYTCMMAMKCCTTVCSLKTQILLKVGKHFLFSLNTGIQIILIEVLERSGTNSIWLFIHIFKGSKG